jgi:cysteine desulfurase
MTQDTIYLDHAAATPMDSRVLDAMRPFLEGSFANPSSLYSDARETAGALAAARATVAHILGAKPTEIVMTTGTTEGDNLAIQGVLRAHPSGHVITTAIEHEAVLACVRHLQKPATSTILPVSASGLVDANVIKAAITDQTVLISLMCANNEIGTIQPIGDITKLVAKVRKDRAARNVKLPLYVHTDAAQAVGYLDLQVSRLGVDLLSLGGSKIYGPRGTGILYVRSGTALEPLMYGGGQERGRRSGTENVAGAVGFALALELSTAIRSDEARRLTLLRDYAIERLLSAIPDSTLNGSLKRRLPGNINLCIPGADGESMVLYLDGEHIAASTGSACTTGLLDPSHVLLAIGLTREEADSSLRLTLGRATDQAAIDVLIAKLPPIVERVRGL